LICENTVDERIVQRAAIKLELDKKIIQEGRFVGKDSLTSKEMLGIIYADQERIMSSAEATITCETIQEIMKRSVEKSKQLEEMVRTSQLNFESFDTIFKFDGESYSRNSTRVSSAPGTPRITDSTRKKKERVREEPGFGIIEITSDSEDGEEIVIKQEPLENLSKPQIFDHQFYDPDLEPLLEKEFFHFVKRRSKKISKELLESLTEEDKEAVASSKALSVNELILKKRYLKNGEYT
jgi:SWI/SNF-related matrix-associated actin-dependent regulator of chromatin subfamily A member 5